MAHMRIVLHLMLDEAEQMLLVHATRVMNVRINLAQVIEVTVEQ